MLRQDIACGIGRNFVDGPGGGVLGGAGGGVVVPGEASEVEVVAVRSVEELVVGGVAGAGYSENFVGLVFAVKSAVGQVDGKGALRHLRGGGDSAGNRGAEELDDRGHFKFSVWSFQFERGPLERRAGWNRTAAVGREELLEAAAVEADAVDAAAGDGDIVGILSCHRAECGCGGLKAGDAAGEG